jgi:hypothetical protein
MSFVSGSKDGLTGADEIAQEMVITKAAVSKLAKKGIEASWLPSMAWNTCSFKANNFYAFDIR